MDTLRVEHKIQVVNGREYHLTRMANGAWNIAEEMSETEWDEYCQFLGFVTPGREEK